MTHSSANLFAQLLTEAIYQIRHRESKSIHAVQDELGYALGKRGGASIEYWRKGNLPAKSSDLEILTRAIVQRGGFSSNWAAKFLTSANHPYPASFLGQLFGEETAVSLSQVSHDTNRCRQPICLRTAHTFFGPGARIGRDSRAA